MVNSRESTLTMKDIFIGCQEGQQAHPKLVKALTTIYEKSELKEFTKEFGSLLRAPLVVSERAAAVERTLNFVTKFTVSFETESKEDGEESGDANPFVGWLFRYLLKIHDVENQTIRFRVCQLINKLLNGMTENAQLDDDLYNDLFENVSERMSDKVPAVRVQAVHALSRLQDPSDDDCPIIKAYLFHMNQDPNADVRKAVLSCIGASIRILPSVIERTRDVKDTVRRAAFLFLSEKVHIRSFTIAQRVRLIHEGLNDRSESVKKVVEKNLLKTWMKLCNGCPLKLLECLDVENYVDTVTLALNSYFDSCASLSELTDNFQLLDDRKVIPADQLTSEASLYWQTLCHYLKKRSDKNAEELLENSIPELLPFCEYLESYISRIPAEDEIDGRLQHDFICQRLLNLASVYDYTDSVGRSSMDKMIKSLFLSPNISASMVKPLIGRYCDITSGVDARVNQLAEIISEIREPMTVIEKPLSDAEIRKIDVRLAKLSLEINTCKDELDSCISLQDFAKAQQMKDQITEMQQQKEKLSQEKRIPQSQEIRIEKNDPPTLQKCLMIICELLEQSKFTSLNSTLHSMLDTLLLSGVQNADPLVRNLAVRGVGLCCLLNKDVACQHLILLLQICQLDQETIRMTALKAVFDILMMYGLESFNDTTSEMREDDVFEQEDAASAASVDDIEDFSDDGNPDGSVELDSETKKKTAKNVTSILTSLLDSEFCEVSATAAEGLGKLLFMGRIYSGKLLSRLIIMWYNPVTEDNLYLRHFLGIFLPAFASVSRKNQECYEEAFMPTLLTLCNAPASSPLAEIDIFNVAKFMLQLTTGRREDTSRTIQGSNIHDLIAVRIANEIIKDPLSYAVKQLIRILGHVELDVNNASHLRDLQVLTDKMTNVVKDKSCDRSLRKFKDKIEDMLEKVYERNPDLLHQPEKSGSVSVVKMQSGGHPPNLNASKEVSSSNDGIRMTLFGKRSSDETDSGTNGNAGSGVESQNNGIVDDTDSENNGNAGSDVESQNNGIVDTDSENNGGDANTSPYGQSTISVQSSQEEYDFIAPSPHHHAGTDKK